MRHLSLNQASLVALSLSACLLSGCPNGGTQPWPGVTGYSGSNTPATSTNTATSLPPTGAPAATPINTTNNPATATTRLDVTTLQGVASLQGQPLANATIQVVNALTNTPAGIVAAGSGNLTTDAQGNFSVPVTGLVPGTMARMIVTSSDANLSVSALVSGEGLTTFKGYRVADATFQMSANETTLCLDQMARGVLAMCAILKPSAAGPIIRNLMAKLSSDVGPLLAKTLKDDPATAGNMAYAANKSKKPGDVPAPLLLTNLIFSAQVNDALAVADRAAIVAVLAASKDPANVLPNAVLGPVTFYGTNLQAALTAAGLLTITDAAANQIYTLDPSGGASGSATGGAGPSGPSSSFAANFNPTFNAYAQGMNTIALTVNQNSGDQDFGAVYIKMPSASINQALTAYSVLTNTGSKVTRGTITGNLALNKNDAARHSVTLPSPFGGATYTGPAAMWAGYLAIASPVITAPQMATYQIFPETVLSPANYYVALEYNAGTLFSPTVNGAKTTTLFVNGITASSGAVTVQYMIVARDGVTVFPPSGLANYTIPATLTP